MSNNYQHNGYIHKPGFFSPDDLDIIQSIIQNFHDRWLKANKAFYQSRAVNSAYITGTQHLSDEERMPLFQFIGSDQLVRAAHEIIADGPAFMNTQLFFNPHNPEQKNYWHRDGQYTDMSIEEQKCSLGTHNNPHFRVPLVNEPGIELIPGSHRTWDTDEEFDVRMEQNGKRNHDDLPKGKTIPLNRGDLLVFSANMIHRGLYGGNRLAFDIIFCDPNPDLLKYVDPDCLPSSAQLPEIKNPQVFSITRQLKDKNRQ